MGVKTLRGTLGFLTRLPVGNDDEAWRAFGGDSWSFAVVGYLVGGFAAAVYLLPLHPASTAAAYVASVYLATGVNHLDGVADVADALAVHGDAEERTRVLKDADTGVAAAFAVSLTLVALAAAALALADAPLLLAAGVVVAAEVGAKTGVASVAAFGEARHEGLGSKLTTGLQPRSAAGAAVVAAPAALLTYPHPAAAAALLGALAGALGVYVWSTRKLGGVNGDVMGAANEVARVLGLHAGVLAWTLY